MENEKQYHWCWDKCQWVDRMACESRILKGKCKILDRPKNPTADIMAIFHKERGEIQIECEETR